ncbi:MAG: sigma-70 family RNA polymerase sigma factor [Planctomycetes bacterium]|nr:sigma-70 family RNA polymerase sigma factor [Planctomycetota bacterium]
MSSTPHHPAAFLTTRWSVVLAGASSPPQERRAALEDLARAYWYPLYAFARRHGLGADEAADQTQAFFALLLERNDFAKADPARGRFRAFLLTAFKHHLSNERARARAAKRGGGRAPVSLDAREAETRFRNEPADEETPERLYERAWTRELLARTFARLRAEQDGIGRARLFDCLRPALAAEDDAPRMAAVAQELALTENAVKVAAHRLRKRFGELLREEVAGTLTDPAEVETELRGLLN